MPVNVAVKAHNESEHPVNESGNPGKESGDSIIESENPINERGHPINESEDPINESGSPGNENGDRDNVAETLGNESGDRGNESESRVPGSGDPGNKRGDLRIVAAHRRRVSPARVGRSFVVAPNSGRPGLVSCSGIKYPFSMPRGLITGEELSRLPDLGPCELVDGRIVPMPFAKLRHGDIEAGVGARLQVWADDTGLGRIAGGGVGVYTRWNPDTVRAADTLFISHERLARCSEDDFLKVAPELIVEVLSPEGRWEEVMKKVSEYCSIGVLRVWIFDPKNRSVLVYRFPEDVTELGVGEILTDEELLPGFSLPLTVVFRA